MDIFGVKIELTFLLSLWGAILSSALAILKLSEYRNNRFRIEVSPVLRGCAVQGHDISIQNISSKPVLLIYMEIFRTKDGEEYCIWSPEDSLLNARIEPYDCKVYNFSEAEYFTWEKGVCIRLCFAGKKPIIKNIM